MKHRTPSWTRVCISLEDAARKLGRRRCPALSGPSWVLFPTSS